MHDNAVIFTHTRAARTTVARALRAAGCRSLSQARAGEAYYTYESVAKLRTEDDRDANPTPRYLISGLDNHPNLWENIGREIDRLISEGYEGRGIDMYRD